MFADLADLTLRHRACVPDAAGLSLSKSVMQSYRAKPSRLLPSSHIDAQNELRLSFDNIASICLGSPMTDLSAFCRLQLVRL